MFFGYVCSGIRKPQKNKLPSKTIFIKSHWLFIFEVREHLLSKDIQSMAFFMQKIMEEKILNGNKLIALFVGKEINGVAVNWETPDVIIGSLKYHSDWNELMFVVEYLEDLSVFVDIGVCECFIYTGTQADKKIISGCLSDESKIHATYTAVLTFVENYIENDL